MENKKGNAGFATVLVVLVLAILIGGGGLMFFGGYLNSAADDVEKDNIDTCDSTTTPALDPDAYDAYNKGTALTETTNLYRKVGDIAWATFTQGTAIDNLQVGEKYELVFGITTSDFTDNGYGPHIITDKVPCLENWNYPDQAMFNDEVETGLTATFYNDNHDASAQTFTAGSTKNIYTKFEAGTDEVFGNPFIDDQVPNVVCLNLNSSEWDKPEKVSVHEGYAYKINSNGGVDTVSLAGKELKSVSTPLRHTAVASMIAYCYEAPIVGPDGLEIKIKMDADDTNAPGTDMVAHLYAANFFISEEGDVEYGVEDEDGNAVGTDDSDTLTLDFT